MDSLNDHLQQFVKTKQYWTFSERHRDYLVSDGVRHAAEYFGLFWFLDVICSYQVHREMKCTPYQVWELERNLKMKERFLIKCMDSDGVLIQTHDLAFCDFEMEHFRVLLLDNKIFLPSENT